MSKRLVAPSRRKVMRAGTAASGDTIRVVAMRTGLGMDTLRAWERRYGFPKPERRPGSNRRVYSKAAVDRLVLISNALEVGYRVGDVIEKTSAEIEALLYPNAERAPSERAAIPIDVNALVEHLTREDLAALESMLRQAATALGPRRFVVELAHPFAVAVGEAWAEGRLEVRHEHLASECLTTQIRHELLAYQDLDGRPLVLLATLPGEHHTLALQMVALYLAVSAAKPRLLGAATPPGQIAEAASALQADVVGITVTNSANRADARRDLRALRRALGRGKNVWVGGSGAASLDAAESGVEIVDSWAAIDAALANLRDR